MFAVVISTAQGDTEYKHTQRKTAERQYKQYIEYPTTLAICLVHSTRKVDEVLAYYERD